MKKKYRPFDLLIIIISSRSIFTIISSNIYPAHINEQLSNFLYIDDHEMHDGLGHEVPDALVDNSHVGVHQVTDSFHFTLQLRVHGEVI